MTVSRDELKKVTALARLELSKEETEVLARDCQTILDYFEIVKKADTNDAQPAGILESPSPLREDSVDPDRLNRRLAEIAPAWREGYFVLPRLPALDSNALDEDDGL